MKKPKNESLGSAMIKDGRLKWIHINSNAIPKKESEPIGPTSTPKTSVYPRMVGGMKVNNGSKYVTIPKAKSQTTPKTSVRLHAMGPLGPNWEIYRGEAAELFWRYKALKVINQKLLSKLMLQGFKTYAQATDPKSNITPSASTDESGRLTYEAGRWKTSNNTSTSSADFYKKLRKDKKFMALAERAYNEFNQGYAEFIASGVEPGSQPDPSPYK